MIRRLLARVRALRTAAVTLWQLREFARDREARR